MLCCFESQDADLLGRLATVATTRACDVLGRRPALGRCEASRRDGPFSGALAFETWCVRDNGTSATITAFAFARDQRGHECIAASGRFTFSIVTHEKESS